MLIILGIIVAFAIAVLLLILSVMTVFALVKQRPLPKKLLIATLSGMVVLASIFVYEHYLFTFEEINTTNMQEGPGPLESPDETFEVSAYYEPYGGAAGGVNVWVEVVSDTSDHEPRIIYYSDAKSHFQMEWIDDKTLRIENDDLSYPGQDRSVTLDVTKEIYHDRGAACRSWVLDQTYETCYEADT
ncbi:hypothetical protein ABID56_001419 [Alkalibacillus flavidus]|uniref:Uncharacterized protein n=1 Tax=Alkalibacillus flavidus TaxID=546021 RepID=A0ABV2KUR9_9BACI